MELSYNIIQDLTSVNGHFNKCIELSNEYIATAEDECIYLYEINGENKQITKFHLDDTISDLLLINNEYFISSQLICETLLYFNIKNLTKENVIKNIDSFNSNKCLLLKEYI